MQKSIKNQTPSKFQFRLFFIDFWKENGGMLAPKSKQKSMSTSTNRFYKSTYKTIGILMIIKVLGVKVESQNRQKTMKK